MPALTVKCSALVPEKSNRLIKWRDYFFISISISVYLYYLYILPNYAPFHLSSVKVTKCTAQISMELSINMIHKFID